MCLFLIYLYFKYWFSRLCVPSSITCRLSYRNRMMERVMMVMIYWDWTMLTNQKTQHIRIDFLLVDNTKNVPNLCSGLQNQKYGNGMLHLQKYIKLTYKVSRQWHWTRWWYYSPVVCSATIYHLFFFSNNKCLMFGQLKWCHSVEYNFKSIVLSYRFSMYCHLFSSYIVR